MAASNTAWHIPPSRARVSPGNRPNHAVRYTWAGPFNTQLYDDKLTDLSKQTHENLSYLASRMMQKEPCSQYSITHYHPQSPQAAVKRSLPGERPASRGSWSNSSVMFSSASTYDAAPRPADDASSVISMSSSGAMNFCYLCSTLEEHQRNHMKLRVKVPLNKDGSRKLRKQQIQYIAPPPRVRKKVEEEPVVRDASYKVTVFTGDIAGASTDANVYITIAGDQNILPKTKLWRRCGTSKFCFVRGSKEVFHIRGPKLGEVRMITIEHDGLEKKHGWYVDRVEIQCMQTNRIWIFSCKNWLSMHHSDFRTQRDLEATEKERVSRIFEVTVETGDKRMAGTDANVYLTLHGTEGASAKHHLNAHNRGTAFQRGQTDKFQIRTHDLGEIRSMRIEHDGQGVASGWFLSKVTLQDMNHLEIVYHFLYNGWLAKDIGDGLLWRELRAKKKLPKEVTTGKPVVYEVLVKTGNVLHGGTDANVYIIFIGSNGKTAKLFMDDANDNFERGVLESFKLKAMNVGNITNVIIGHDNSGVGAGWFCDYVKVRKHLTRQEITDQIMQQKKAWKTSKQQHKRLADKLKEKENGTVEEPEDGDNDKDDAGSAVKRDERFADMFDRDGKVVKVPVYEEYHFPCNKWFAADEGDGLIERELALDTQTLYFQER